MKRALGVRPLSANLQPPNFTTYRRCEKTVFMPTLTFAVTTVLAQIVLTLRFVALGIGRLNGNHG